MNSNNYFLITSIIFGLVALMHLYRAVTGGPFMVGSITIPIVGSWIAFIAGGFLSYWGFKLKGTS